VGSTSRQLARVLLVEDNAPLRGAIASILRRDYPDVLEAETAHEALALLDPAPDLVICDVRLPDGSALRILEATLEMSPEPLKIAMSGNASAEETFRLAQLGVGAYLPKPFPLSALTDAIERVRTETPALDSLLRGSVGKVPMRELQQRVRRLMVGQALAISSGSRSGAARLLAVTRQAIQQVKRSDSTD
jgi:DNA-binding response OmpR family regulator